MRKVLCSLVVLLCVGCVNQPGNLSDANDPARNDLAIYAISLDGTPYQWGGDSPDSGFDCSGFVRHVYQHSLGMQLPRTSREISQIGREITPHQLRPGDLVFFNTMRRAYSHVGIYLGDSRFIHAPRVGSSIRVDDISQEYWKNRFDGARRI